MALHWRGWNLNVHPYLLAKAFGKTSITKKNTLSVIFLLPCNWSWRVGDRFKEREVANAIRTEVTGYNVDVNNIVELAKNQREYQ